MKKDFDYDNNIRREVHPMHKYYLDNYGITFLANKYIESILNCQKESKYIVAYLNEFTDPYNIIVRRLK